MRDEGIIGFDDMKNETAAVVVTHNRKELLKNSIECLLSQSIPCDVFVFDNASNDGTEELVGKYIGERVYYYNTGANLGASGGFELGIKKAAERGYKFIWVMDDDTWPTQNALEELLNADKILNGNWGCLSSVAYWTDGSICRMNIQKKSIFKHVKSKDYCHPLYPIKMCSFVSLLTKTQVIKDIGLPIGEYFIWTTDYEFSGRISMKYPCYMVPSSRVIHAMKNHMRVNFAKDDASRLNRYNYIYRNDVHCYRQYGVYGWIYLILKDLYTCFDIILHSDGDRMKKIRVVYKGFKEGIAFHPDIKRVEIE